MMLKNSKIIPGSKVGILGLGITGKAAVRYVQACGATVYVSDNREVKQFLEDENKFLESRELFWEANGHTREFLAEMDLILLSPGINPKLVLLEDLRKSGVEILGELALAADHLDRPVVGITGTNGKTTVTTLIGNIFKQAGKRVFVGGNIGTPLYNYLLCPEQYDLLVLELSSFQLEECGTFSPDFGILLNISPDHIDWHGSMEKYIRAKRNLFSQQLPHQKALINGDDPHCSDFQGVHQTEVFTFGSSDGSSANIGSDKISLRLSGTTEEYYYEDYGHLQGVNRINFGVAILATRLFGLAKIDVYRGLKSFKFLPHRLEYVDTVDAVAYYNDSKATNTGAVIGALAQFDKKVVLIAGGRDKGDDYSLLRQVVQEKVTALILFGEATELFAEALKDLTPISRVKSMEEAVFCAAELAASGEAVVLSPGCASFDMFSNYGHRGNEFKNEVARLKSTVEQMPRS